MGPKERREREREETRTRILDAARDLFVAEGYDSVTMRRIAERIEYSPTAIYFHFRDKETLLNELCATDFLSLAHQFQKIARIADPVERLRKTGHAYVQFGIDNPNHYRLMFMTPKPPVGGDRPERGNPEEDAYAFLKMTIAEAIEKKLLRPELKDVELLAQTIWAGVHGVISLHIAKQQDDWVEWRSLKRRVEAMVDLIVAGITREEK
jgi:AcrR family transcriptional regulator